ncbi:hypothetical protein ABQF26_21425, partial [Mycolicibacterium elephantis]
VGVRDLPELVRQRPARPRRSREPDRPAVVPTATVHIDLAEWDACAERLHGTSNALIAGFAAQLGRRFGRVRAADNFVTLSYPVNDRTENDLRANAIKGIDFAVDPAPVTSDLRDVRNTIKQALVEGAGKFKDFERVFPLIPMVPTALVKKVPLGAMNSADLQVGCSNLGELDPAVAYADGTEAETVSFRMVEQNLTTQSPELAGGELNLGTGRINGKLFLNIRAYQPGGDNSRQRLRELVAATLADFGLTGVVVE